MVVHGAGIMRVEAVRDGKLDDTGATVATNLLGSIRLTAALLPLLVDQPRAAIHSYAQSLRYQLKDTPVQILELIPPYVRTSLMGEGQANDPNVMLLEDFIAETMHVLETSPAVSEIVVEGVKPLRFAEVQGNYDAFFTQFNDATPSR